MSAHARLRVVCSTRGIAGEIPGDPAPDLTDVGSSRTWHPLAPCQLRPTSAQARGSAEWSGSLPRPFSHACPRPGWSHWPQSQGWSLGPFFGGSFKAPPAALALRRTDRCAPNRMGEAVGGT